MPKSGKKNRSKRKGGGDDDAPIVDERFAAASNRPQFRTASKSGESGGAASGLLVGNSGASKVELDDRFAAALTDPRFRIGGDTGDVDKYGRKRGGKKNKKKKKSGDDDDDDISDDEEGMGKFYTLKKKKESKQKKMDGEDDDSDDAFSRSSSGSSSSDQEESDAGDDAPSSSKKRANEDDIDDDGDAPESNDPEARIAYLTALSRGEIYASSSSSDESSSEDDSSDDDSQSDATDEDSIEGTAGVLDPSTKEAEEEEVEITHEESPYLAVCNMDWTQVRAVDLFAILSSFCPPGSVKRVRVYPSDFGMERMKKEEVMGPAGIWKKQKGGSNKKGGDQTDDENDDEVNERFEDDESSVEDSQGSGHSDDDEDDMDEDDVDLDAAYEHFSKNPGEEDYGADNDFDPEKLRAYEASKMKYYFAVATFASPAAADAAYREVDGMEVGHSSAMIDLRSIPPSDIKSVVKDREVRDECDALPSTYESPDFVVAALQQTAVRCTWEDGDTEREKKLTQYGVGNEAWAAMTEGDDLRAYLASDHSSDEDSDEESDGGGRKDKGARMRALLGLGSDDEGGFGGDGGAHSDASSTQSTSDSEEDGLREEDEEEEDEEEGVMTTTYVPGKRGLEDKIRSKLEAKNGGGEESAELTPWEKYQLKRKEKRRERRQAIRAKRKDKLRGDDSDDGGSDEEAGEEDGFFLGDDDHVGRKKKTTKGKKTKHGRGEDDRRAPSTKEELELLIAGDNDEEAERDFDMRGIARKEKLKGKKLKGKRKRKEAEKAADVSGTAFSIDTTDNRFAAVLDGSDELFGIDRTDPNFKDTPAMQKVLAEQSKRRKAKKRAKVANDVSVDAINRSDAPTGGTAALSSLVKSLKTKVANKK